TYSPTNTISPKPHNPISIHDLLLLSPSPAKRSKPRLDVSEELPDPHLPRRRCKNRFSNMGSPRNSRRSRRRLDHDIRDDKDKDKDFVSVDELVGVNNNKVKKRRQSGKSKKEKLSSSTSIPSPKGNGDDYGCDFDRIGAVVNDLIMWNDVAKSTLWFGFGSLCFLSSCFTTGVSFSMLSLISQLGLLCLGVSFFSNMIAQRNGVRTKREVKVKEEDVLRAARVVLPAVNFAISKAGELFSGEPSMTLKVAPCLLIGYEYGHIVTFKRLCALGKINLDMGFGFGLDLYRLVYKRWKLTGSLSASLAQNCTRCTRTKYARKVKMRKHGYWKHGEAVLTRKKLQHQQQQLIWTEEGGEEGQQQAKTLTLVESVKVD
ncbi:hypothetical protein M8C21_000612, partial [Ambrosia artemisiifolia]